jgi:peroxiredoxin Q/BCP
MAQLHQEYPKFTERDAEVIAVGPEDAKGFADFWLAHRMPFPGIPDPQHRLARLYGQQVKLLKFGRMPALAVIDKAGRIRYAHYADSMSDIATDDEILALLDDLNKESTRV